MATLLAVVAAVLLGSAHAAQTILASDPLVQKMGRTFSLSNGSFGYEWLGSGFRLAHTGTTLWANPVPTNKPYKISFAQKNENFFPPQGAAWVTSAGTPIVVASGPSTVRVTLNVPVQYWAGGVSGIASFTTDGTFQAPSQIDRVLHFIGDSITAATNIHGLGIVSCGDGGYESDYGASWAGLICSALDANCTTVAVGGKGLVRNCCDGPPYMPEYYTWLKYTTSAPVPFQASPAPAGIVVYLGTNDYSNPVPGLDAQFTAAFLQLMFNATKVWYGTPSAPANITFFATLGPMSPVKPAAAVTAAVQQGKAQGYKVFLINATTACGPALTGCTDGCASHPGVIGHRNLADAALPIIRSALGW